MKRVLTVSTSYPLRVGATSGIFVQSMVRAYSRRFETLALCPDDDGLPVRDTISLSAFRYAPRRWQRLAQGAGGVMPALRNNPALALLLPGFLVAMSARIIWLSRRRDLIHANWAVCAAVAAPVSRLLGKPCVVTLRGSDVALAARSRLQDCLLRLAVSGSVAVVCVADTMAQDVRERFPEHAAKVGTIVNGVDEAFFTATRPPDDGVPIMLSIGSLIPGKGFDVLLAALSRLTQTPWQLRIAGDGPLLETLQQQARDLGVADRVLFLGAIAPDRMPELCSRCHLFVLASRAEGRSNVVLEAMAAAMPIIASRIPGIADLVDDSLAWLVTVSDAEALAAGLSQALADPGERERRGRLARQRVLDAGWTWSSTGDAYADLFEGIMDGGTGAA
jgi:glycosyltransferase involved in cell wall biosynthesis